MTDLEKFDAALRTALGLPEDVELAGIACGRTEGSDSVAHTQPVAAVENAFGHILETEDVIAMSDYGAIRTMLQDHHDVAVGAFERSMSPRPDLDPARRARDDTAKRGLFAAERLAHYASFPDAAWRYTRTWCAKEAAAEALGRWVRLDPRRVVVTRSGDDGPSPRVSGWDAVKNGASRRVSLSDLGAIAVACTAAWGAPTPAGDDPPRRGRR